MEYTTYMGMRVRAGEFYEQDCAGVSEVIVQDVYHTRDRGNGSDGEIVFDIGAHIGSFAVQWRAKNPSAKITCVEVAPENIPVLEGNVGHFAKIVHAACTYETGDVKLLNTIQAGGNSTGGSRVASEQTTMAPEGYWLDDRPIRKVRLEDLMSEAGTDRIDVLKLDCEGSEFSILENCMCLDRIGFICGEFHDPDRWNELQLRLFSNWPSSRGHTDGWNGIFHMQNPRWR